MAELNKVSVDDLKVTGKRVLVRVDFNVPMKDGVITNDNRIQAALPTINKLVSEGAKVILCSHLGKPKNGPEEKFSLKAAAARLAELVSAKVTFVPSDVVVDDTVRTAVDKMQNGEIVVLENTRFRKEETKNIESFSKDLASIADAFVMDAFGSAHRAHCSTVGVTEFVKETAVGYLMQKEIKFLGNAVENPVRPFVAILGGAKVADKLNVISNLLEKCDTLIIGGGMAYTFLKAQVLFSLMRQYVPCGRAGEYPEIDRPLSDEEYDEAEQYLFDSGIEDGFVQEKGSASDAFIPAFDGTGVV